MPEHNPKITELEDRLDALVRTQINFQKEISLIRSELMRLRSSKHDSSTESRYAPPERPKPPVREPVEPRPEKPNFSYTARSVPPRQTEHADEPVSSSTTASGDPFSRFVSNYAENARADLEKFIGENLISKIGIVVLVLGVGIGAKYAIDNNLISPLARIVVAYVFGFGLVGLAIKLKPKYHNFSAVLISGGMAITYFVTYFAYSAYGLMSQLSAFAVMAMFTVFTVAAALVYSRQVIAHVGLVGAYAVPFLLSSDSGNYFALFTYMGIINIGILAISIKKDWKPLFYTSSAFTWAIFYGWFIAKYSAERHFYLAIVFLAVFFAIFYATKLIQKRSLDEGTEKARTENLVGSLITGFIFYAFCFALVDTRLEPANYWAFFGYLAFASIAILATSFREYGRAFMYLVVPFGWLIYGAWYLDHYRASEDFQVAAVFASVFFGIFYFSILFHRLIEDNFNLLEHTTLVLSNAFVFYGFGYSIMQSDEVLRNYLGLYTAANAGLHLAVSHTVNKIRPGAVDVVQTLIILVLTFASISIPVQFDGNFVTLIWSAEAALLFWFGRTRGVRLFEYFSYPVMVLATASMFMDWAIAYQDRISGARPMSPVANGDFVTALIFVAAFGFIYLTNRDDRFEPAIDRSLIRPLGFAIAAIGTFVLYNMFRIEIGNYFHLKSTGVKSSGLVTPTRPYGDLQWFNIAAQIDYSILFLIGMGAANLRKVRSTILAFVNSGLGVAALAIFATVSMVVFSELRFIYMSGTFEPPVMAPWMHIAIRPISYLFAFGLIYSLYNYSRDELLAELISKQALSLGFEAIAYAFVFIVASCELINLMGQFRIGDATKLGLSILWGVYALTLIVIGIARDKKHLRIAAFVLLGVTLAKLFLYDIADLDTIPKTILFVTLGITLLVISFLYNKYKSVIFKADVAQEE